MRVGLLTQTPWAGKWARRTWTELYNHLAKSDSGVFPQYQAGQYVSKNSHVV